MQTEGNRSLLDRLTRTLGFGQRDSVPVLIYEAVVAQARHPAFYRDLGVEDSVDGRFDVIVLHMFAVLHRFRAGGEPMQALSQALFDTMFADMDRSLREMGVSDMSIGKRVRAMADAFYGRVAAYDAGLADERSLAVAIRRNVYRDAPGSEGAARHLAAYLLGLVADLATQPDEALAAGTVGFPEPER